MDKLICGFLIFILAGCGRVVQKINETTAAVQKMDDPKPVQKPLTDHDKVELLRAEAAKRGLRWKVWCIWWAKPDDEGFQAVAWYKGHEEGDETHDRWMFSAYTQADAAYQLYQLIQGAPTHPGVKPEERKKEKEYRRICPRELGDDNHNEPCTECKIIDVNP